MSPRLRIKVIIGSTAEDALGWKCCNLEGMNLELHVMNAGRDECAVKSAAEFTSDVQALMVDYWYPNGVRLLEPGQTASFFCGLDQDQLKGFNRVRVFDDSGRAHEAPLTGELEDARAVE